MVAVVAKQLLGLSTACLPHKAPIFCLLTGHEPHDPQSLTELHKKSQNIRLHHAVLELAQT